MSQFFLSAWRAGLRSKSFQAVLVLGLTLMCVAYLSASFSPRQPKTIALDVGLSGLRISLVLMALFWVQEFVSKEIERRLVYMSLTYPVSRSAYLAGRYLAVLALCAIAAVLLGLLLFVVVLSSGAGYPQEFPVSMGVPYWATIAGLWLDAAVVAAFALCIASLSTVGALPLVLGLAFAVGGKALGPTLDYLGRGEAVDLAATLGPIVSSLQWLLPDLSRLDWRPWPMYSLPQVPAEAPWAVAMAVGYILLMFLFATALLARREFT